MAYLALARVQDDHVADVAGVEQVYVAEGWAERFAFPFAATDIGYGHSSTDVAAVRVEDQTLQYLRGLTGADLDRVVDAAWDPPVTLAVRLVSVVNDDMQHAGQAAFIRGVLARRSSG